MKTSFVSLKLRFNEVVGEGRTNCRQIGITASVLRDIAIAGAIIQDYADPWS